MRVHPARFEPALRNVLAPLTVEGTGVAPNYSVRFRPDADGRPGAHVLFAGCETLARSRSPRRVILALLRFLDGHATEDDGACLQLDATAVVREGRAIILPATLRSQLAAAEEELTRRGLGQIDGPLMLDPQHGDVVVRPPASIPHSDTLRREVTGHVTPEVNSGRFQLHAWAWHTRADGRRASRGQRTAQACRIVRNRHAVGGQRALEAVARGAATKACWLSAGRTPTTELLDLLAQQWWD